MLCEKTYSHRFWREQCAATRRIRARFGLQCALDYLIAEKLLNFIWAAQNEAAAAAELPAFAAEVRRLFTAAEIRKCLDELQRKRKITRQESVDIRSLGSLRLPRSVLERLLL